MKIIVIVATIAAWAYLCHLAGKFCGFNQLGKDDDAYPEGKKPKVAGESQGKIR